MEKSNLPSNLMSPDEVYGWMAAFGVAVVLLGVSLWHLRFGLASRSWPSAEGVIESSEMKKVRKHDNGTAWQPKVKYRYQVDGRDYVGGNIAYHMQGQNSYGASSGTLSLYPSGAVTTVYYDPGKPSRSVLEPGISVNNYILLVLSIALTAAGAWLAFFKQY